MWLGALLAAIAIVAVNVGFSFYLAHFGDYNVVYGSIGAALAYLAGRFARRPRLTFLAVTIIALAGYAVVPFTAAESTQTAIWLNVFHVLVAIPVIGILTRYLTEIRTSVEA